jgi:hypothetical protein
MLFSVPILILVLMRHLIVTNAFRSITCHVPTKVSFICNHVADANNIGSLNNCPCCLQELVVVVVVVFVVVVGESSIT